MNNRVTTTPSQKMPHYAADHPLSHFILACMRGDIESVREALSGHPMSEETLNFQKKMRQPTGESLKGELNAIEMLTSPVDPHFLSDRIVLANRGFEYLYGCGNIRDKEPASPLRLALERGYWELALLLMASGADALKTEDLHSKGNVFKSMALGAFHDDYRNSERGRVSISPPKIGIGGLRDEPLPWEKEWHLEEARTRKSLSKTDRLFLKLAKVFKRQGFKINEPFTSNDETPALWLIHQNPTERVVYPWLCAGADLTVKDALGNTVWQNSKGLVDEALCAELIRCGISLELSSNEGRTAVMQAVNEGSLEHLWLFHKKITPALRSIKDPEGRGLLAQLTNVLETALQNQQRDRLVMEDEDVNNNFSHRKSMPLDDNPEQWVRWIKQMIDLGESPVEPDHRGKTVLAAMTEYQAMSDHELAPELLTLFEKLVLTYSTSAVGQPAGGAAVGKRL